MAQSFKYTFKILKNTKGFLASMTIMPIIMILLVSITLAYSGTPVVGYTGNGEIINRVPGIRVKELKEEDIEYFLGTSQGNLVVKLNDEGEIQSYKSSLKDNPLINKIEMGIENKNNNQIEKPKIEYSIGVILFKLLTSASLVATFLIQDKDRGIFVRIRNSKTGIAGYIIGKAITVFIVYEIANIIILLFYKLAGFEFGRSSPLLLMSLFTITIIISMGVYIFIASIVDNEGFLWTVSTAVFFPLALCSGVLFPIKYMPKWMKTIAHISPQYYLQKSFVEGEILLMPIIIILLISMIMMILGIKNLAKKN
ncbi:MAG: ABC transporter permease [Tissierellia bacterium]|nr:ABC transporter permease [Tissierellia bacterium]